MNSNITNELIIKNKKTFKSHDKMKGLKKLKKSNVLEKKKIRGFFNRFGIISAFMDGIARVKGLDYGVKFGEVVHFKGDASLKGMVMSLIPEYVECVIFFNVRGVREGDYVIPTGKLVSVSIGKTIFGRVIDAFGKAIDLYNKKKYKKPVFEKAVDSKAAGISARDAVYEPMLTGQLIIDAITPIGLGQRELIIGDRQTGKTTTA